jgi:hypothetical protein
LDFSLFSFFFSLFLFFLMCAHTYKYIFFFFPHIFIFSSKPFAHPFDMNTNLNFK